MRLLCHAVLSCSVLWLAPARHNADVLLPENVEAHVVLRGPVNGFDLDRTGVVARSSTGSFVVSAHNGTKLAVFDSSGKALRTFGREGDAPGEFRRISAVLFGPGDSLWVLEASQRTAHIFDSAFRFVRRVHLPFASNRVLPLSSGDYVIGGLFRRAENAGYPFHRVQGKSGSIHSFGIRSSFSGSSTPPEFLSMLALDGAGSLWSVSPNDLRLVEWSRDGSLRRQVKLTVNGFTSWSEQPAGFIDAERPNVRISDLAMGPGKLATVLLTQPAPNWSKASAAVDVAKTPLSRIPLTYLDRFLDSRILVVDLQRSTVVADIARPARLMGLLSARLAFSITEDADGLVEYRVWTLNPRGK